MAEQVPEKNIILNDGYCPRHKAITPEQVLKVKQKHPNALVLSHPECVKAVLDLSDYIGSTAVIIDYAHKSEEKEFIICTEDGVNFKLTRDNPHKIFHFVSPTPCCRDMKLNTLENILSVLEKEDKVVEIDEATRKKALVPLDRMLECAK